MKYFDLKAFEDIWTEEYTTKDDILFALNIFFTFLFTGEMVIKWLAMGLVKYFTDGWSLLDFFVVVVRLYFPFQHSQISYK